MFSRRFSERVAIIRPYILELSMADLLSIKDAPFYSISSYVVTGVCSIMRKQK